MVTKMNESKKLYVFEMNKINNKILFLTETTMII